MLVEEEVKMEIPEEMWLQAWASILTLNEQGSSALAGGSVVQLVDHVHIFFVLSLYPAFLNESAIFNVSNF